MKVETLNTHKMNGKSTKERTVKKLFIQKKMLRNVDKEKTTWIGYYSEQKEEGDGVHGSKGIVFHDL